MLGLDLCPTFRKRSVTPMKYARPRSSRTIQFLSICICAAVVYCSLVMTPLTSGKTSLLNQQNSNGQGQERRVTPPRPRRGPPAANLPNLDELRTRNAEEPVTPDAIPSTVRSRRISVVPWDGIRVGDPLPVKRAHSQSTTNQRTDMAKNWLGQSEGSGPRAAAKQKLHHTRALARAVAPPLPDEQYLQNFFYWTLLRYPNAAEATYWNDILRTAYARGTESLILSVRELGRTLFESADYAGRGRSDHDYVYDLYKTYLYREPDQDGWNYWTNLVPTNGRVNVRRAFDYCNELANLMSTVTPNGGVTSAVSSLSTARVDPFNQTGNQVRARDAEWAVSLLNLPGRAGLDLGLTLSYSSLVWTRSGPHLYFDQDNGWPSPGFRLGFPTIQEKSFDAQAGQNVFVMITPGGRVALRQVGSSTTYEAADSSYLQLIDNGGWLLVRSTDGTQFSYGWWGGEWHCIQIKDRNGNYLTVNYDGWGHIITIIDTLGRVISFNYDGNANLQSITQPGMAQPWATFGWSNLTMAQSFSGVSVTGTYNGEVIPVVTQVGLNDGTHYNFEYSGSGQVIVIRSYRSDNVQRAYTIFDYTGSDDCPRMYQTRVWADNWTGVNGVPTEVATQFNLPGDGSHQMVAPDGTVYKEFYGTGWQKGLVTQSEFWGKSDPSAQTIRQKWTTMAWTQDNTSVSYQTNPRVIETNIYDAPGNRRRQTMSYNTFALPSGASCSLPSDTYEYQVNAADVYRRSHVDYRYDSIFMTRHIIGLPAASYLFDSNGVTQTKVAYDYDWPQWPEHLQATPAAAVQHDEATFGPGTAEGRGNLVLMQVWDASDPSNYSKVREFKTGYWTTGAVAFTRDPLGHQSNISYGDSFSDGNNSRNTFAYPTTLTDADGFQSFVQYNFNFGATTRTQGPPPAGQSQGAIQSILYDDAARLRQVTTQNTGAYIRYVYGPNYLQSFSTINNIADEAYAITVFDGVGRGFGSAGNHPGSAGGYRLGVTIYDQMGRAMSVTRPFEVDNSWTPAGDDTGGVPPTTQSYDWKGRPLVTTNPDGTYKTVSYTGCGCAGGEVVLLTDEMSRRQKVYTDVLGRQWKTEVLNWDGSVYSTTTQTLNARDQATTVRQYAGTDQSTTYQDTTMNYDGYGRTQSKHMPEQNVGTATVFTYNSDDTIASVTDARGAVATYAYNNNRHLVTGITYTNPTGVTATPNASFTYDAAGNRLSATNSVGTSTYAYDSLSRISSESYQFAGLSGTYTLNYGYNLANEVTSLSIPFTSQSVGYNYDSSGRLSSMSATGFTASYYNYTQTLSSFISSIAYRAWGATKSVTYGNTVSESFSYNSRLQPTNYTVSNVDYRWIPNTTITSMGWSYDYYADGRLQFAHDLTENKWDRSFTYDHAARLSEAKTNRAARGQTWDYWNPDPYNLNLSRDVWGHVTNQTGALYSGSVALNDSASYTNNRRQYWMYDAQGNVTMDARYSHTFDAAGESREAIAYQNVGDGSTQFPSQPQLEITQNYDADGASRKRIQIARQNVYDDWDENHPLVQVLEDNQTSYYVKSTVLDGARVVELDVNGNKKSGWIYAGSQRIAKEENGSVTFEHHNPATGGWLETNGHPSYRLTMREERDPRNAEIPLSNPYVGAEGSYISSKWGEPLLIEGGDPFDPSSGYEIDGLPVSAAEFARRTGNGSVGAALFSGGRQIGFVGLTTYSYLSSISVTFDRYLVNGADPERPEYYLGSFTLDFSLPGTDRPKFQHASQPQNAQPGPDIAGIRGNLADALKDGDCSGFIRDLLSRVSSEGNPLVAGGDLLKIFDIVAGPGQGGVIRAAIGGGREDGSIGEGNATILLEGAGTLPDRSSEFLKEYLLWSDSDKIVHELIHAAGVKSYSDYQLAEAVSRMVDTPPLPQMPELTANSTDEERYHAAAVASSYWNGVLREHCKGAPKPTRPGWHWGTP